MKKLLFVALILCAVSFAQTNVARMLSGVNAQTGTSYTFVASDVTKIVTFNNANPVGATLPVGSTTGFGAGSVFTAVNLGAGTVTVSCSGCTINGAATVQIVQNQSVSLYGDGTNYISASGGGGGGGGSISGSTALGTQVGGNGAGGFSSNAKPFIDVRDYGVDCTGVGDSTTALQTMINNAPDYSSFLFPPACKVTITGATGITIDQRIGLQFIFAGRNGNSCAASGATPAEIVYTQSYASGNRVFYINRSQSLEFRNMTIKANATADVIIDLDQVGATPPINTRNDFYNLCLANPGARNSAFNGVRLSNVSLSNVDNIHFYHPDIQCSGSAPTSNASNGIGIYVANTTTNTKNIIIDDLRTSNCSSAAYFSGGDLSMTYGLDSSSWTALAMNGFNDMLTGFRTESMHNAVNIVNPIGPHLITHNDFAANAGTIVDAPTGCGILTYSFNQQDSAGTTTIDCHSGGGTVVALNNRNFNMSPTTAPGFVLSPYLAGALSQTGGITNLDTNWFSVPLRFTPASGGADYGVVFDTLRSGTYDHFGIQAVPQNSDTSVGLNINYLGNATGYIGLGATVPGLKVGPNTTAAQSAPTISPRGAVGATSYTYLVQAVTMTGHSDCSTTTTVSNANAVLNGTNFNVVIWGAYAGAVSYKIYRTASGGAPATTGLIGTQIGYTGIGHNTGNDNTLTFSDTGLAGDSSTCTTGNTTGGLLTAASTAGRAGLNIPHGTAPSSPADGDFWTTTAGAFVRINGGTIGPLSAGGGGGLSGMTTLGIPIATSPTNIATSTVPGTNQGTYILGRFNTVQGSATSPIELQAGDCSTPGVISGATATYTIVYTDVIGCNVVHDIAASHSTVVTIPNPATLNNPAPIFVYTNNSLFTDTLTPSTYQISMGSAAAGASLSVPSNVSCKVQLDPVNGSTYKADCHLISTSTPTVTFSGSTSTAVSAGAGVNSAANGTVLVADGSGNAIPRPAISTVGLSGVWTNGNPLGIPVANGSNSTLVNATMYVQQVNLVTEQVIGNATFDMVTCAACAEVINACVYNSAGSTLLWSGVSGTINGTGAFSATGTQATLTRGVYYFAYSASGGGVAVIQGYTAGGSTTDNILNKNAVREGTAANGISGGACPASLGVLTGTTTGPAKGTFALEP